MADAAFNIVKNFMMDLAPRTKVGAFTSTDDLVEHAVERFIKAVCQKGKNHTFHVAFSGGRIAKPFLTSLAQSLSQCAQKRASLEVYFADERCVPLDHSDSNFSLFTNYFLPFHRLEDHQLHPYRVDLNSDVASEHMVEIIQKNVNKNSAGMPVFDLIILGMGEDGHVASLFPENMKNDIQNDAWVHKACASKPPTRRLTMGYRLLETARNAWVMVSGKGKGEMVAQVLKESTFPLGYLLFSRVMTHLWTDFPLQTDSNHQGSILIR